MWKKKSIGSMFIMQQTPLVFYCLVYEHADLMFLWSTLFTFKVTEICIHFFFYSARLFSFFRGRRKRKEHCLAILHQEKGRRLKWYPCFCIFNLFLLSVCYSDASRYATYWYQCAIQRRIRCWKNELLWRNDWHI